jgi:hypothetical protein
MHSPIVSLTFSPRSDFLATSHVDSRGLYLWANKNYFSSVFLKPVTSEEPSPIQAPTVATGFVDEEASKEDSDDEAPANDTEMNGLYSPSALWLTWDAHFFSINAIFSRRGCEQSGR